MAVAGLQWQDEEFRRVIGMLRKDYFFELCQIGIRRFEDQQNLGAALDFAMPPVVRFDFRDEIGAGDQSGFQRGAGQAAGGFEVGSGDEGDTKMGGGHSG